MGELMTERCNELHILPDGHSVRCRVIKNHTVPHKAQHPITKIPVYWSRKVKVIV